MTLGHLLRRNLRFHWRSNIAVFLAVAVGAAVLTGALLVGDSLRGSLRDLARGRLGWVSQALVTGRFFREGLASELRRKEEIIAPCIMLQGTATALSEDGKLLPHRAGKITILGVNDEFEWANSVGNGSSPWIKDPGNVVALSQSLAEELHVKPGDDITLQLQKSSPVPRESLLGRRESGDVLAALKVTVVDVLGAKGFGGQFNLTPSPAAARNAFVPLSVLQNAIDQKGRVNALLVSGNRKDLTLQLGERLAIDDWALTLQTPDTRVHSLFSKLDKNNNGKLSRPEWRDRIGAALAAWADKDGVITRDAVAVHYKQRGYFALESKQMLLDPAVADAALKVAKEMKLTAAPTLVYLANQIAEGDKSIPYSVVAALDPSLPAPLGSFLPAGVNSLKDDEIILAEWKESVLPGKVGDAIRVTYFRPEQEGKLDERTATFKLRGLLPMIGSADDPDLTPEFPGITDKLTLSDWNPPFPYDNKLVRERDERYWKEYRTTPKAYITLAAGQKFWGSRFGDVTSIRFAPAAGADLEKTAEEFRKRLLAELKPEQGGFIFDPVRERALAASVGGNDFGMLFLAFSFFLIAAALLLVGLMFRLNMDRRAAEIGLLLANGYRLRTVRRLLLEEGAIVAVLGGLFGCLGAVAYAWAMIEFLRATWPGEMDRSFLHLHVTATSILIGYVASVVVSLLTIVWAVRLLSRVSPSALLMGSTAPAPTAGTVKPPRWGRRIAIASAIGGLGLLPAGFFVPGHEARAGTFFGGGALLLTAGLAAAWTMLKRDERRATAPRPGVAALGARNASRHPARSLLTAGLLASAAFLVVAVESFRRQPDRDFLKKEGGSGGFSLMAETDVPIYQDLNEKSPIDPGPGRAEILEALERRQLDASPLKGVTFSPFRVHGGDDASCLNLYQPGRPRLLGVPRSLVARGGFHFAGTLAQTPEEKANPWLLLEKPSKDDTIPVFGEANTVQWMLKTSLGGIVEVPDERGRTTKLRLVGLLKDSVFQGELLMSEANFLRLYPGQEGYGLFLIDAPPATSDDVKGLLETALADRGFEATPTPRRLAAFLAVENTYLSTFQMLGGLGLLLGALGLAVVLLRSVWERRGELALLRALGFRRSALGGLVLAENVLLLAIGLGVGVGAALLAVAPHVLGTGGDVPWLRLLGLLGLVLLVGLAAGAAAMAATLRAPLLPALRRE